MPYRDNSLAVIRAARGRRPPAASAGSRKPECRLTVRGDSHASPPAGFPRRPRRRAVAMLATGVATGSSAPSASASWCRRRRRPRPACPPLDHTAENQERELAVGGPTGGYRDVHVYSARSGTGVPVRRPLPGRCSAPLRGGDGLVGGPAGVDLLRSRSLRLFGTGRRGSWKPRFRSPLEAHQQDFRGDRGGIMVDLLS